jgi:hypothetical protein
LSAPTEAFETGPVRAECAAIRQTLNVERQTLNAKRITVGKTIAM